MRSNGLHRWGWLFGVCAGVVWASPARAQPWVVFEDVESGSLCGLVNTADSELVVLADTGELVLVSGEDVILEDTFVDDDNTVFFDGFEFGFIDFFEDADGFATLWWVTPDGDTVEFDDVTGEPVGSGFFPDEFGDVACDACEFWDDPADCEVIIFDEDEDGVEDDFDDCPGTPPGEPVDPDGCSCLDFDSDADGVDDCIDECDTPPGEDVDPDGCSCLDFDTDNDGVDDCIDECDTPSGEDVDPDGCSCFDFDSDADGVDDCSDDCPGTPLTAAVDENGCTRRSTGGGGGGGGAVIACGAPGIPALALTVVGMMGLGLVRRRRWS